MQTFHFPIKNSQTILALGAESAGNFSVFHKNKIYFSEDFGDLLDENNFSKFKKAVLTFMKKDKVNPDIILTDLHPLMKTTLWGAELAKKYKTQHIQVQHHHAHIFSAIGERLTQDTRYKIQDTNYAIALDGTGYGEDEKIWGGEVFELKTTNYKLQTIRIGHLDNQVMIGGDLAIREPARMLIAILAKDTRYKIPACRSLSSGQARQDTNKSQSRVLGTKFTSQKDFVYSFVKKYYTKNEFEVLYNQLQQNFICIETSSTGRILDAMSLLLGFCDNQRKYKHEPIDLLEKNSTKPYTNLRPRLIEIKPDISSLKNSKLEIDSKFEIQNSKFILDTNYLFNYVINYLHTKDKKRLAATAQRYIAEGLFEIIQNSLVIGQQSSIFASGGVANNKIIADYFTAKNIYLNKNVPRGDAGLSFGQISYYLLCT